MKNLEKLVLILPNVACFVAGSIHGSLEARNIAIGTPQYCLWIADIAGTGIGKTFLTKEKESYVKNAAQGILLGVVAAPIEYAIGYALGYSTNYIVEKMFSSQ